MRHGAAVIRKPDLKKHWSATPAAFERFLAWLDDGGPSGGERYVEIRRRLVAYFARRRCAGAEDLADETLHRVARRLDEEGAITDTPPARYCYIVARFVLLESLRNPAAGLPLPAELPAIPPQGESPDAAALGCLDRCLTQLAPPDRDLILEYYADAPGAKAEVRRRLAQRLGSTANAVMIRASRIRARLEACVSACLQER